MARKNIQLHFVPTVPVRRNPFSPGSFTPSPAFTMTDLRVQDDRSRRSRWPIFAFTMTDLAVHDGPIFAFTMTDLAVHDGPIFAFTMVRNSQYVVQRVRNPSGKGVTAPTGSEPCDGRGNAAGDA